MPLVLPLRPEQVAGLLVSDADLENNWLKFGSRMGGADFTKAKTTFVLPFPAEIRPLIMACIGGRAEGPLLRERKAFAGRRCIEQPRSADHLEDLFAERLLRVKPGTIACDNDRKKEFRKFLVELGGVSTDYLAKECKTLLNKVGLNVSLMALRHAVSHSLKESNIDLIDLRYLTSHAVNDIMNSYVSVNPIGSCARYFDTIRQLLEKIRERCGTLGIGT